MRFHQFIQVAGVIDQEEADLLCGCGVRFLGFPLRLPVHQEDLGEEDARAAGPGEPPAIPMTGR